MMSWCELKVAPTRSGCDDFKCNRIEIHPKSKMKPLQCNFDNNSQLRIMGLFLKSFDANMQKFLTKECPDAYNETVATYHLNKLGQYHDAKMKIQTLGICLEDAQELYQSNNPNEHLFNNTFEDGKQKQKFMKQKFDIRKRKKTKCLNQ